LAKRRHKINGRPYRPPTKWLPKNRKVLYWYGYTTKSEPILSQIRDFEKSRTKRGLNTPTAQRPASVGLAKPAKIFQFIFKGARNFYFQKRSENFCGVLPLRHSSEAEPRQPNPRRRAKIPSLFKPLPFCPPARAERVVGFRD